MDHRLTTPVPGSRVTVPYRKADGHGCPGHVGTVLAFDDPRAWGPGHDRDSIARTLAERAPHMSRTPIAWDFGRVYWEPSSALECV